MSISNYPSEFQSEALEAPTMLLSLDPVVLATLLAVLALTALAAWWLGTWQAGRARPDDRAIDDLHKALVDSLEAAMKASSNELPARAQAAAAQFERLLGPLLVFGAATSAPLKALNKALVGDVDEKPKDEKSKDDKSGDDKSGDEKSKDRPAGPGAVYLAHGLPQAVVVQQQVVLTGAVSACACPSQPCACPKPEAKPAPKSAGAEADKANEKKPPEKLPVDERARRLRAAIQDLYDHWSVRPDRIRELKAARRALSVSPPAARKTGSAFVVWTVREGGDGTGDRGAFR